MIRKKMHQAKANDTFNTKKWNKIIFDKETSIMQMSNDVFEKLDTLINNKPLELKENQQFNWDMHIAKHFSIRLWINNFL